MMLDDGRQQCGEVDKVAAVPSHVAASLSLARELRSNVKHLSNYLSPTAPSQTNIYITIPWTIQTFRAHRQSITSLSVKSSCVSVLEIPAWWRGGPGLLHIWSLREASANSHKCHTCHLAC